MEPARIISKRCAQCGEGFEKSYLESAPDFTRRRFCSRQCYFASRGEPIAQWMRSKGVPVEFQDGWRAGDRRVHLSSARLQRGKDRSDRWLFNFDEPADFYVLRLERPRHSPSHLVLPGPLEAKTLSITLNGLMTRYQKCLDDLTPLMADGAAVSSMGSVGMHCG